MTAKCVACGKPVAPPYLRLEFVGNPDSRLTGSAFFAHAGCIRLRIPDPSIEMPERISDPDAELPEQADLLGRV